MNFLNSPGANLLHLLGVHMPGQQPPAQDPNAGAVQPQGGFAGHDFSQYAQPDLSGGLNAGLQAPQMADIPKPPHSGFFNRLLSVIGGGA